MKANLSPTVVGIVIAVLVAVLGFIGYKVFFTKETSGKAPPEAQKWLPGNQQMRANTGKQSGPPGMRPSGSGGPSGGYPGGYPGGSGGPR